MMRHVFALAAALMLPAALPARADILGTGSDSGGQGANNSNGTWVPVRLNGSYYSVTFSTATANKMVRVLYTASCNVVGAGGFLALKIQIDGVDTTAWSPGGQFCSPAPSGNTGYSAVQQGTLKVARSGSHKVTVFADGTNTTFWSLSFSSTVVDQ